MLRCSTAACASAYWSDICICLLLHVSLLLLLLVVLLLRVVLLLLLCLVSWVLLLLMPCAAPGSAGPPMLSPCSCFMVFRPLQLLLLSLLLLLLC